jgi:hypothetical protein
MIILDNRNMKLVIQVGGSSYQVRAIATSQAEANTKMAIHPTIALIATDVNSGMLFLADVEPLKD